MNVHAFALLLAALALVPAVIFAAPATAPTGPDTSRIPPNRQPDKEIVYKKTPQGELKFFVYLPPDWKPTDKRPAILLYFGGGWRIGSAAQFLSKAEYFASRGMVALCVEYRIQSLHQTSIREAVLDARSAFRFLRKNAADWGVDPDRIIASGGSSGGHLAVALCFDGPDEPADDLQIPCKPAALILFNPVLDLIAPLKNAENAHILWDRAPGATDDEKKKYLAEFSPIEHLKKNAPPTLALYGDKDKLFLDARTFAKKSTELGNKIEIFTAPNVGHGFFNVEPWHTATLIKSDEFLATLGFLKGPPTLKPTEPAAKLSQDTPAPIP